MKVKMLSDFRGRETGERLLYEGGVFEIDEGLAEYLIKHHKAERVVLGRVEEPSLDVAPAPKAPSQPRKRRGK